MPRIPIPENKWHRLILVLALIALAVIRANQILKPAGSVTGGPPRDDAPPARNTPPRSGPAEKPPAPAGRTKKSGAWTTYEHCTLVEHRNNDGDSFDLLCGGEKLTVRLYFVDCPEKRRHQYNGERIADQANYFECSEEHAIATGEAARDFAEGFLRNDSVTFTTRMESVYDSGRVYGFVNVGGMDMGEALVARGMARIHTKGADSPSPGSERDEKDRLLKLERDAKAKRLGGWQKSLQASPTGPNTKARGK